MPQFADHLYTVPELAVMLRVSRSTLYRLIKQHQIPCFRIGGNFRISAVRLAELMRPQNLPGK